MGVEHNQIWNASWRPSVQIRTNILFNSGLFVLSLDHLPVGAGVYPSWYMTGPDWPNKGEIDIIEGISNMTYNMNSILTGNSTDGGPNCLMKHNDTMFFNGTYVETKEFIECYHCPSGQKCAITASRFSSVSRHPVRVLKQKIFC